MLAQQVLSLHKERTGILCEKETEILKEIIDTKIAECGDILFPIGHEGNVYEYTGD